jgi:folate-binding protein YgfZ
MKTMTEMRATPFSADAAASGARLATEAGWQVPGAYADLATEIAEAHGGAAVADLSHWGAFTLGGKDGRKFLQGLVTNDVVNLPAGTGCYAAFLNVHGRIEADAYVFAFDDHLVIQTPPEAAAWVEKSLGRFRLAGDFKFASVVDSHAMLALVGPRASSLLGEALGVSIDGFAALSALRVEYRDADLRLLGTKRSTEWSADVLGPVDAIRELRTRLVETGAAPVGVEAIDLLRLEAAIPRLGRDFDSDTVLQEIDVPEIVSFTKGCYLGQEIVARLHYLGQPSKLLRRLEVEGDRLPKPGDQVVLAEDDAKVAGVVTSAAVSPAYGPIALAMIKRKFNAPGTRVRVRSGDAHVDATVAPRQQPTEPKESR